MTAAADLPADPPPSGDDWTDGAEDKLREAVRQVRKLRDVGPLPAVEHGPAAVLGMLQLVRERLDEVETVLSQVSAFRTGARALSREADALVDDTWAEKVGQGSTPRARVSFNAGFDEAPRERYAKADVAVLGERRKARRRARVLEAANDAVEQVRLAHRGLDGVRTDLYMLLRAMGIEGRFERSG